MNAWQKLHPFKSIKIIQNFFYQLLVYHSELHAWETRLQGPIAHPQKQIKRKPHKLYEHFSS